MNLKKLILPVVCFCLTGNFTWGQIMPWENRHEKWKPFKFGRCRFGQFDTNKRLWSHELVEGW